MSVFFLLLPVALVVVAAGVWAFVWAARRGQYDDLDTPALRVLHDDVDRQRGADPAPPVPPDAGQQTRLSASPGPRT